MSDVNLNGRQIAILALLGLFGLLAFAPALLLNNRGGAQQGSSDPAYQALKVYSRSQLGDRSADAAALQIYPTLIRRTVDGHDVYNRKGADGVCWELDLTVTSEPVKADASNCSER